MKAPTKIGLQDLLRAGHVKRWHICNVQREQTLADHSYMVTTIALALYHDLVVPHAANVKPGSGHEIAALALSALYHDAPEVRTGDIPTPGKQLIKLLSNSDYMFDAIDLAVHPELPFMGIPHKEVEHLLEFIVMADKVEAATWIRENGVGPRAKEVADKCWDAMEALATRLEVESNAPWREAVNKILDAMLCPRLRSSLS